MTYIPTEETENNLVEARSSQLAAAIFMEINCQPVAPACLIAPLEQRQIHPRHLA